LGKTDPLAADVHRVSDELKLQTVPLPRIPAHPAVSASVEKRHFRFRNKKSQEKKTGFGGSKARTLRKRECPDDKGHAVAAF